MSTVSATVSPVRSAAARRARDLTTLAQAGQIVLAIVAIVAIPCLLAVHPVPTLVALAVFTLTWGASIVYGVLACPDSRAALAGHARRAAGHVRRRAGRLGRAAAIDAREGWTHVAGTARHHAGRAATVAARAGKWVLDVTRTDAGYRLADRLVLVADVAIVVEPVVPVVPRTLGEIIEAAMEMDLAASAWDEYVTPIAVAPVEPMSDALATAWESYVVTVPYDHDTAAPARLAEVEAWEADHASDVPATIPPVDEDVRNADRTPPAPTLTVELPRAITRKARKVAKAPAVAPPAPAVAPPAPVVGPAPGETPAAAARRMLLDGARRTMSDREIGAVVGMTKNAIGKLAGRIRAAGLAIPS